MRQIARNLIDVEDGFLRGKQYLILDRDAKYSDAFRSALLREGIHVIRLPPRSPNLNAFSERFVRSIKEECLSRMIFLGRASLRHAVSQYMSHYHSERNHRGLENRLLRPVAKGLVRGKRAYLVLRKINGRGGQASVCHLRGTHAQYMW